MKNNWFSDAFDKAVGAIYSEAVGQALASARDHVVMRGWFGEFKEPAKNDLGWVRDGGEGLQQSAETQSRDAEQVNEQSRERDRGIER